MGRRVRTRQSTAQSRQKTTTTPKNGKKETRPCDSPGSSQASGEGVMANHVDGDERECTDRQPPGLFTPVTTREASPNTTVLTALAKQVERMQEVQNLMLKKLSTTTEAGPTLTASRTTAVPTFTATVQGLNKAALVDAMQPAELRAVCPVEGVPDTTLKAALKGEFVYLDQFLLNLVVSPENEGELCQYLENGQVNFRPRRSKRKITNFSTWLEAWNNYERLMTRYHGLQEVYEHMADYRAFIGENDKKYTWAALAAYDIRHRAKLSRKSVYFSNVDISLQAQLLDATAVKTSASRCYRCKSFLHTVSECPFPPSATQKPVSQKTEKRKEVCRNFNNLKCVVSNCPRQHVCKSCSGELPYELCIKSGPCSQVTP